MRLTGATLLLGTLVWGAPPAALAEGVRDAIAAGNADFAAGRYAEALAKYEAAGEPAETSAAADLLHNRAAANFKLGAIDEARELWVRATAMRDAAFEAACHYNLGNCDYADGLKAVEGGDAAAARAALKKAAARYRDALRLDPGLANARANLELAAALQKQLEESPTSQPESQSAASQQGQPDQNTSQPSENQQQNPDQQGEQEQRDGQSSTQPNGEQQQREPASQPESGDPQSPPVDERQPSEPENDNQSNDNRDDPASASENQNENRNDNAGAPPQPAEAQNENGNESPQPQPQPATTRPSDGSGEEPPNPMVNMTREQAERLLQKIRDMEKARRQALLQRERSRHKPVDKDW